MPNYDLGTARGKIKVEADTRGASNAERALKAFERSISALAGKLGSFEASMNKIEAELRTAKNDFEKAERASDSFDRSIGRADLSTRAFSSDVLELKSRLKGMQTVLSKVVPPAVAMTNVFREFRKTGSDIGFVEKRLQSFLRTTENGDIAARAFVNLFGRPQQNNMVRFATALHRVGLTSIVLSTLQGHLIGTAQSMKLVTGRQAGILKAASSFRTLAFGVGIVAATTSKLDLWNRSIRKATDLIAPFDHVISRLKPHITDLLAPLDGVIAKVRAAGPSFRTFAAGAQSVWKNTDLAAKGAVQLISGIALTRYGINGLIARFQFLRNLSPLVKAAIGGALYVGPALFQATGKALSFISNLLVGLLDGVKQLSGGFLALPGAISLAAAAFGTLKVITSGIKSTFEDLMKAMKDGDPAKIAEAMDKLPPSLKGVGQALVDVIPKWKQLQQNSAITFLAGSEQQIRKLSDGLIPVLDKGITQIATSWRMAKDQVVDFVKQGQTLTDVNRLSSLTSQTMNQLSGNIQPLLAGFRDISIVGAQFLSDLSAGLPSITQKFAAWAAANRENGQMLRWMQEGWRGLKDLVNGLKDAGQATWALLTMFKTNNGDNFLDRFATSMDKFNKKVEQSLSSGGLKTFADFVKSAGTDRIKSLWEVLKDLGDALVPIAKFVTDVSRAFNTIMTPAIEFTIKAVQTLFEVLNQFGVGNMLGTILGLVGAFKLLGNVIGPLRNVFQIFFGLFTGFKGAQNLVLGLAGSLENFGSIGRKASGAIMGIGDSLAKWGQRGAIAALAIGTLYEGIQGAEQKLSDFNKVLDDSKQHQEDFRKSLEAAFMDDRGLVGKNVLNSITDGVDQMLADVQSKAATLPGVMDHIKELWFGQGNNFGAGMGPFSFAEGDQFNAGQKAAQDAEHAQKAFERLKQAGVNLSNVVQMNDSDFAAFADSLRKSGEGGNEAADQLAAMHQSLAQVKADFDAAGPGGTKLAAGIEQIASAAGDSQTKLEGMKTALEGLGLLQTNQYEAAFSYAQAIQGLGDAAQNAAANITNFNDIMVPGTNTLNTSSAAAQQLFNTLNPIAEKFLALAANGGNVNQMWQDMQPQLQGVADAFKLTVPQVQDLIQHLGAVPGAVNILVQLEGKDAVTQGIGEVLLFAQQNVGKGINIPIIVPDPKATEQELEKTFGDIFDSDATSIKLKVNVDPNGIPALKRILADHGISVDGQPVPAGAQAQVPVAPVPPPAVPATPAAPRPAPAPAPAPAAAPSAAPAQVAQVTGAVDALKNAAPGGKVEFTIIAHGYDETVAVVNQVKDAIQQLIDKVNTLPAVFAAAFQAVQGTMTALANGAGNQGSAFVDAYAAGLRNNPAAVKAAEDMAQAIKDRFHNSPPKKGPLSQHGDQAKYAGGAFVDSYASGMQSQYPVAGKAADGLASLISSMQVPQGAGIPGGTTPFLGQLSQLLDLFQHINSSFGEISGLITSAAKFISDPMGKGTFFGQSAGAAFGFKRDPTISDADLAQRRQDKAAQAKTDGTANGAGYTSDQALLANVPAGRYSQKGTADLTKGLGDCSSAVEDLVNIMDGAPTGGRQMSTGNAATWLTQHGFKPGAGGPGDMRVAFNVEHMQATLPGGTNFNYGSDAAAAARGLAPNRGADDPALTQRYYRPASGQYYDGTAVVDPNAHQGTGALPGPVDPMIAQKNTDNLQTIADNSTTQNQTQDQVLNTLRAQDGSLNDAIRVGQDPNSTDAQVANSLSVIQKSIDAQNDSKTPNGKAQLDALQGVQDSIKTDRGMTTGDNPIDSISNAAAAASNVASDVMSAIQSGIEAFGAANDLVNMANRYPSNSEDIMKGIDDIQKFIEFGAKIASTVSDVLSTAGSFTGGSDFGGTAAAGQIASLVSGALTAVNNAIDIGQEVYRVVGTYLGPFLGALAGGSGGALEGQVKMLLDENAGQLFTYSADNPQDKRGHNIPGVPNRGEFQQPVINATVYGGPGSDPRDNTRDMMFQIRAASQQRALAS